MPQAYSFTPNGEASPIGTGLSGTTQPCQGSNLASKPMFHPTFGEALMCPRPVVHPSKGRPTQLGRGFTLYPNLTGREGGREGPCRPRSAN